MSRWIDADKCITVQLYDDMYEEWSVQNMTIAECLNRYTEEGCPSVEQQRPKGEWQIKECDSIYGKKYILTCAECGGSVSVTKEALPYENFCRECGADMRGSKE